MKNKTYYLSFSAFLCCVACGAPSATSSQAVTTTPPFKSEISSSFDSLVYQSENLIIRQLSDHIYLHTSFLDTESFGKVSCNGMVVINMGEAIVFDTPTDEKSSLELFKYFSGKSFTMIKGVVATHFHADCVGGLKAFHQHNIPSYAAQRTSKLLKEKEVDPQLFPLHSFDEQLVLKVGDQEVYAEFFGEGHTNDRQLGYFAEDKVMLVGCLIRETGAGKGNMEDANVEAWPVNIRNIKQISPETALVIPVRGETGGTE